MELKLKLSTEEHKELVAFCNLNDLLISSVIKDSFTTGFNIERFGLLNQNKETVEKIIEKEVIKYVEVEKPVEIIKEVQLPPTEIKVIEYVEKEVIKEVPVEKIVNIVDNSQIDDLIEKNEQLKRENEIFSTKIQELESQSQIFSTKNSEMENIFQNEKNELLLKIQQFEKESNLGDVGSKEKLIALQATVQKIRTENIELIKKIKELEKIVEDFQKSNNEMKAIYLNGSNLNNKL